MTFSEIPEKVCVKEALGQVILIQGNLAHCYVNIKYVYVKGIYCLSQVMGSNSCFSVVKGSQQDSRLSDSFLFLCPHNSLCLL